MRKTSTSDRKRSINSLIDNQRDAAKEEQELEYCLGVVACVIKYHGECYWPVYELFEEELEKLRSRRRRLNKTLGNVMAR